MLSLKQYQQTGVKFITSRPRSLLADDMGLGKTVQAIAAINELTAKNTLIVCPATVKYNWQKELMRWLDKSKKIQIVKTGKDIIDDDTNIVIVNYELAIVPKIRKQLLAHKWAIGIIDEAHKIKNEDAQRTKVLLVNPTAILRNCVYIVLLTGTPVLNWPSELFIIFKHLCPEAIEPYTTWALYTQHFCDGHFDKDGVWDARGFSNIDELNERLKCFMIRRTKEQVLRELPPTIDEVIYLDINWVETDGEDEEGRELPLSTLRRVISEKKFPDTLTHVRNVLAVVPKLVIFAHHRKFIEDLSLGLQEFNPVMVYGGSSAEQKQQRIDKFIDDPTCRVLIGQIQAAGQAIDGLQKVCSTAIFAEHDWSPGIMDQALDRLRRIGQMYPVMVQYLVASGTLEETIVDVVTRKRRLISQLLKQEKEKTLMALEDILERIAVALETQVQFLKIGSGEVSASLPKPTEKKPAAKKPAAKKAIDDDDLNVGLDDDDDDLDVLAGTDLDGDDPTYTIDDVKAASTTLLRSSADVDGNKAKAREIIKKVGGVDKIVEIPPKKYAAVIAAFEKAAA